MRFRTLITTRAQCIRGRAAATGSSAKSKAVTQACLTSANRYVAELNAIKWGSVQPQADTFIKAIDRIDALLGQMANATTAATVRTDYDQLVQGAAELLVADGALRAALGLPPVGL